MKKTNALAATIKGCRANGLTWEQIATKLNRDKIRTATGGGWNASRACSYFDYHTKARGTGASPKKSLTASTVQEAVWMDTAVDSNQTTEAPEYVFTTVPEAAKESYEFKKAMTLIVLQEQVLTANTVKTFINTIWG